MERKTAKKETYLEPEVEIVSALTCDVLAASPGGGEIEDVNFELWNLV